MIAPDATLERLFRIRCGCGWVSSYRRAVEPARMEWRGHLDEKHPALSPPKKRGKK